MKKIVIVLVLLLLLPATNAFSSISDYLKGIDKYYIIVLGSQGRGADSFAAADINKFIRSKLSGHIDLPVVLENEVNPSGNKILIGHPCDNHLIQIDCNTWPYDAGQALIKIINNDLIIAGSTPEDTRMAAKVIANFKQFPLLKDEQEVIVLGNSLNLNDIKVETVKKDFVCGDNICEVGEKLKCFNDCSKVTCVALCRANNLTTAFCRDIPSNPNVAPCKDDELSFGEGYCASGKGCCCSIIQEEIPYQQEQPTKQKVQEIPENLPKIETSPQQEFTSSLLLIGIIILVVGSYLFYTKKRH